MEVLEIGNSGYSFPKQTIPTSKKNLDFVKKCTESAIEYSFSDYLSSTRMPYNEMVINYNLVDGFLDKDDMHKISNPWGIDGFDRSVISYQLIKPRLNLLLGEEFSRKFDWAARVTNPEAIDEKEESIYKKIFQVTAEIAFQKDWDENMAKEMLEDLQDELEYSLQDRREEMATDILNVEMKRLSLKEKFNKGFSDVIISAEECYHVCEHNGRPDVRVVNPLTLTVIGHNDDSIYIEDSDIIIEDSYYPIGWVIDYYNDYLTTSEIQRLEDGLVGDDPKMSGKEVLNYIDVNPSNIMAVESTISTNRTVKTNAPFDKNGNVRVVRTTWRSRRKIGVLKFFNEEGIEDTRFVTENYVPNKELGENITWIWPTEWWSAVRIADNIYPSNWGPVKPIMESIDNPFVSTSGYIGTIYKVNTNKAYSMLSSLKSYQYLYDELMDRLKEALAKYQGPMMELDMAKMPADWKPEQWLYYARKLGYLIIDSFKEGDKGAAKGVTAGSYNTTNKILNPDLGDYISQTIGMLSYIEDRVGEITGINRQRLGAVESREMVGSVERAVTQSNHITQRLFELHNNTKLRVLQALLDMAKYLYKDKKEKLQYVTDDMNISLLHLDGFTLSSADYSLFILNGSSDPYLVQTLRRLTEVALQSGTATITEVADMLSADSVSVMRRKLRNAEKNRERKQEQAQRSELEAQQQMQAQMKDIEEARMQHDLNKLALQENNKITLQELKNELEKENIRIAEEELEEEIRSNKANEDIDKEDLDIKRKGLTIKKTNNKQ